MATTEPTDYHSAYYQLLTQYEILEEELEDAKYRENTYKRQLDIMAQANQDTPNLDHPR
jgi:hypothetical protein